MLKVMTRREGRDECGTTVLEVTVTSAILLVGHLPVGRTGDYDA
jgi:hypothetical protein